MAGQLTTFIIPSIDRDTLTRAVLSVEPHPFEVGLDKQREGAGIIRNRLIEKAKTEWVSMLDDDDTITEDYVQRLEEESKAHPEADVIHFREYFNDTGELLPYWPELTFSNVGVSFSVKRQVAIDNPFEAEPFEDYEFLKRLNDRGYIIHFSKYIVYRVRH